MGTQYYSKPYVFISLSLPAHQFLGNINYGFDQNLGDHVKKTQIWLEALRKIWFEVAQKQYNHMELQHPWATIHICD